MGEKIFFEMASDLDDAVREPVDSRLSMPQKHNGVDTNSDIGREGGAIRFCAFCGERLSKNDIFCMGCGKEVQPIVESTPKIESETKESNLKWKIIVPLAIIALVVCFAGIKMIPYLVARNSIKNGDIQVAVRAYNSLSFSSKERILEELYKDSKNAYDSYNQGKNEYDDAYDLIKRNYQITDDSKILELSYAVDTLLSSKNAFSEAETMYKQGDWMSSIASYSKVIEEDTKFDEANARIKDSISSELDTLIEAFEDVDSLSNSSTIDMDPDDIPLLLKELIPLLGYDTSSTFKDICENWDVEYENEDVVYELIINKGKKYLKAAGTGSVLLANQLLSKKEYTELSNLIDYWNIDSLENDLGADFSVYWKTLTEYYPERFLVDISEQMNSIIQSASAEVINQSKTAFVNPQEDYLAACAILDNSNLRSLEIDQQREYYMSFAPMSLRELGAYYSSMWFPKWQDTVTDNMENTYSDALVCGTIYSGEARFKLNGDYNRFTGVVGIPGNNNDAGLHGEIIIVADGNTLLDYEDIDGTFQTEEFDFDVTGVDEIQIYMAGDLYGFTGVRVMLAELEVQKNIE